MVSEVRVHNPSKQDSPPGGRGRGGDRGKPNFFLTRTTRTKSRTACYLVKGRRLNLVTSSSAAAGSTIVNVYFLKLKKKSALYLYAPQAIFLSHPRQGRMVQHKMLGSWPNTFNFQNIWSKVQNSIIFCCGRV